MFPDRAGLYSGAAEDVPSHRTGPASFGSSFPPAPVLPSATAVQFRETYGQPIHVFYGSSECGGICYDREGGAAERGTVGTPVEGVRIFAQADSRPGRRSCYRRVCRRRRDGYLPESDSRLGAGRFETNDVGAWRGGELVLTAPRRSRHQRARPQSRPIGESRSVLTALDGVDEAVVIGVTSPRGGEEIVRAVVACADGRLNYQRCDGVVPAASSPITKCPAASSSWTRSRAPRAARSTGPPCSRWERRRTRVPCMADRGSRWLPSPFLVASAGLHAAALAALVASPQSWQPGADRDHR